METIIFFLVSLLGWHLIRDPDDLSVGEILLLPLLLLFWGLNILMGVVCGIVGLGITIIVAVLSMCAWTMDRLRGH